MTRQPVGGSIKSDLYWKMLQIRMIEETLAELYKEQEMRTPTHFSIGQEAVAVGVCSALTDADPVYSGHRAHAHYLAGEDSNAIDVYTDLLNGGESADLLASRGMVRFSMGDYAGTIADFNQALRCGPTSTELLNNLGVAQFQAGDHEGSRRSFERALEIEPGHADAAANLCSLAG